MKNISKKRLKAFFTEVKRILNEVGAIHRDIKPTETGHEYEVDTIAGLMGISLHEDIELEGTSVFSIFCRFVDVKKAITIVDTEINPHSGKWNFHSSDELLTSGFEYWMKKLTEK